MLALFKLALWAVEPVHEIGVVEKIDTPIAVQIARIEYPAFQFERSDIAAGALRTTYAALVTRIYLGGIAYIVVTRVDGWTAGE